MSIETETSDKRRAVAELQADITFEQRQSEVAEELNAYDEDFAEIRAVFDLFEFLKPYKYCIAGGAAVDLFRAKDIDIFVLDCDLRDSAELQKKLEKQNIPGLVLKNPGKTDHDPVYIAGTYVIAEIEPGNLYSKDIYRTIQIIATAFDSVNNLLENFDISTHTWAITPDNRYHRIAGSTLINEQPKVLNVTSWERTIARYCKICRRYDLEPDPSELTKLCKAQDIETVF